MWTESAESAFYLPRCESQANEMNAASVARTALRATLLRASFKFRATCHVWAVLNAEIQSSGTFNKPRNWNFTWFTLRWWWHMLTRNLHWWKPMFSSAYELHQRSSKPWRTQSYCCMPHIGNHWKSRLCFVNHTSKVLYISGYSLKLTLIDIDTPEGFQFPPASWSHRK